MVHVRPLLVAALLAGSALTARAEVPSVAVSIKPIHSLVSAVMAGVGTPNLIVQSSGSEHVYSLKPSDASALQSADVVFWIGHGMETFLAKPIESLAGYATVVELSETTGLTLHDYREGGPFEKHDHAHEGDRDASGKAEHDHDAPADGAAKHDHDHDEGSTTEARSGHDGQAHEAHEGHEGHEHGSHDMHVWLDPENAEVMVGAIAATLSERDPENAARYAANAEAYVQRLDGLAAEISAELAPVKDKPVIVFHDAYQYFEKRFGVNTVGSITVSPESAPSAQRVSEIKARLAATGAVCVFAEPQFEPRLVAVVTEGTQARSGVLDPLGAALADGPDLYPELIRGLATSLKNCVLGSS